MFWSAAIILGYFFAGIARVVEEFNPRTIERSAAADRKLFRAAYALIFWPTHVPMPLMALTIHVLIVAGVLWALGYLVHDLVVRAGVVAGTLVAVLIVSLIRSGRGRAR